MGEHKYAQLADSLRASIKDGTYGDGQKLPSENKLAAKTGYSRQTVRQAMSLLEAEGLTQRVQGSGTYVRSRKVQREQTHNIAVVTTYIGEYIFPAILMGIDGVLAKNGYTPLLSATRNRVDTERRVLTELLKKPIDGLILEGTKTALPNPNIDLYDEFERQGIPVVFINGFYPDVKNPVYVVANDHDGGRIACEALIKQGCKRVAGIFKSDDMQGHRRYAGYADALRAAKISVDDDKVMWYTTENRDSLLQSCALDVLKGCDAALCYNDEVALKVINLLSYSGLPEIAVASFDNSTLAQISATPFLSLSSPKEAIGSIAAEKLLNIINGKQEQSTVLPWSV